MAKASWSYRDLSDEISNVEINIADVSAGGADFDAVMGDLAAVGAAILALTACVEARDMFNQAVDTKDQVRYIISRYLGQIGTSLICCQTLTWRI